LPQAADPFTVELPLPPRELSPNVRLFWAIKAKATKAARSEAWYWFRQAKPANWEPVPIRIDVEYNCPKQATGYRPRDSMNGIAAMKAQIDGMVDAGVIPDDSCKWLSWGSFTLTRAGRAGVRITVTPETQSPPKRALVTSSS
jgi:crossover junction endodeoxyribonuclease RusA